MYRSLMLLCDYCKEIFDPKTDIVLNDKEMRALAEERKWLRIGPDKDACFQCVEEKRHLRK